VLERLVTVIDSVCVLCVFMQVASVLLETLDDWHRSYQEARDTAVVHGVVVIATSLSMTALDPSLLLRGRLEVRFPSIQVDMLFGCVHFVTVSCL
jgi:hypothetical protein